MINMKTAAIIAIMGCSMAAVMADVPAFPGAEGYGAVATGGRNGVVYEVTNLNDSGAGSLRAGLLQTTTRTIVFRVSGTIHLNSDISIGLSNSNITIAGQTAPGDGICIANGNLNISKCNNVIIRYIRCRIGDQWPNGTENGDDDAIWGRYGNTIILDHVTASWSIDEAFSFYVNTNFTAQWCLISESLRYSHHLKGAHGYGGIWGSTNSSWHHNLLAHHSSRNPRIEGDVANNVDMRNNVIYNWVFNSCYGGEKATVNIVNCYYKYGPATGSGVRDRIANPSAQKDAAGALIVPHAYGKWYVSGNYVYGSTSVTADNWLGMDPEVAGEQSLCKSTTLFPVAVTYPVTTQSAQDAYNSVLNDAGCSLVRDSVDTRIINEVRTGTATYGGQTGAGLGIIDSQTTVGGWPTLNSLPALADSDHDGMPDTWETTRGLNPGDPADRNGDRDGDGYTNLEEYLNWLCTPAAKADIDRNCVIDLGDFSVFAAAWKSQSGSAGWNPACDIASPANGSIDMEDFWVLIDNWLVPNQ
jgi:pectate lyase